MYEQAEPVRSPFSRPDSGQTSGPPPQSPPVRQGGSRGRGRHGNGASGKSQEEQEASSHTYEEAGAVKRHATYTSADRTYPGGANGRRARCSFIRSHLSYMAAGIAVLLSLVALGFTPLTVMNNERDQDDMRQLSTTVDALKRDQDDMRQLSATVDALKRDQDDMRQLSTTVDALKRDLDSQTAALEQRLQEMSKMLLSCPKGYAEFLGICYKAFSTLKTFSGAAAACGEDGGTLAMPRDAGTNAFLISLHNAVSYDDPFWFGLHDRCEEGSFEWVDGSALGTYNNWHPGEPNNAGGLEDCVRYLESSEDKWNDSITTNSDPNISPYVVTHELTMPYKGKAAPQSGQGKDTIHPNSDTYMCDALAGRDRPENSAEAPALSGDGGTMLEFPHPPGALHPDQASVHMNLTYKHRYKPWPSHPLLACDTSNPVYGHDLKGTDPDTDLRPASMEPYAVRYQEEDADEDKNHQSASMAPYAVRYQEEDADDDIDHRPASMQPYTVSTSRNDTATSGNDAGIYENDTGISGNDADTSGNDAGISGNDAKNSGNDAGTSGNDVDTSGNDTGTSGNDTGSFGNDAGTCGNDAGIYENDAVIYENNAGTSGNDTGTSGSGNDAAISGNNAGISGNDAKNSGNEAGTSGNDTGTSGKDTGTSVPRRDDRNMRGTRKHRHAQGVPHGPREAAGDTTPMQQPQTDWQARADAAASIPNPMYGSGADRTYPGGASSCRALCSFFRSQLTNMAAGIAVLLSLVAVGLALWAFINNGEISELTITVDALKRNQDNMSATVDALKRNQDNMSATVDGLKRDQDNMSATVDALKRDQDMSTTVDALKRDQDNISTTVDTLTLDQNMRQLSATVDALKRDQNDMSTTVDTLKCDQDDMRELSTAVDAFKRDQGDMSTTVDALKRDQDDMSTTVDALNRNQDNISTTVDALKLDLEKERNRTAALEQRLHDMTSCFVRGYALFRGICYKAFNTIKIFSDAAAACGEDGGTLAMPRDAETNAFLIALYKSVNDEVGFWFGLHDQREEGSFEWVDGSALGAYSYWFPGQPKRGSRSASSDDCVRYNRDLYDKWDDWRCDKSFRFICQAVPGYALFRGICYKAFNTEKTFSDAAVTCREDGGTLAMPRNAETNAFLISLSKAVRASHLFWIGLHDRREEGSFEWVDGSALGTYSSWGPLSPRDKYGNGDCVHVHFSLYSKDVQWNNGLCHHKYRFICQAVPVRSCTSKQSRSGPLSRALTAAKPAGRCPNPLLSVKVIPAGVSAMATAHLISRKKSTNRLYTHRTYPGGASGRRARCSFIRSHLGYMAAGIAVLLSLLAVGFVPLTVMNKEEITQLSTTVDTLKRDLDKERNRTAALEQRLHRMSYTVLRRICYKAFNTEKTFRDAAAACGEDGGTLAIPRDAEINAFLISLYKSDVRKAELSPPLSGDSPTIRSKTDQQNVKPGIIATYM
uniref:C-type lectin domain-containing protein n=1 Tax=Branchiostoma floridae TaxID=7739 RepID=C3ZR69_BRAFL|eukprot:XP_002588931.1 hypothetical protein BRAFLDRAFT_89120 [Branchiostoma floridae]